MNSCVSCFWGLEVLEASWEATFTVQLPAIWQKSQRHRIFIMDNEGVFILYGVKFPLLLTSRFFCKTLHLLSVRNSRHTQLCSPSITVRVFLNICVFKFAALTLSSCCTSLWMQQWLRKQKGNCEEATLLGSSLGIKMTALIIYAVERLHWQVVVWGKGGGQKPHLLIFLWWNIRRNKKQAVNCYMYLKSRNGVANWLLQSLLVPRIRKYCDCKFKIIVFEDNF